MLQFDATILANRSLAPGFRELSLSWDEAAGRPLPGQFLTLRVSRCFDPLLRRPFAFSAYFNESGGAAVSIVYQVRGQATRLLSELGPGGSVDVLGPLGHGFPPPASLLANDGHPILAAGGVGLGPLLFLATELEAERKRAGRENPLPFLVGFRSAELIPDLAFPEGTALCTDDGSAGFKGSALDWLKGDATAGLIRAGSTRLCACGPSPMLAALSALARDRGWEASLSAEQWMACGVGACMGCALPRRDGDGFLRACSDGPIFERDDIDWEAEASRQVPPRQVAPRRTATETPAAGPARKSTIKGGRA